MVKRNPHFKKLQAGYLFPEIFRRKEIFQKKNPGAHIISLGIGDTTEPLPEHVAQTMHKVAKNMGTYEGYKGYSPPHGLPELREKIASKWYNNLVKAEEVSISDGAKCDLGRFQMLFGSDVITAVQDPAYPVYVDTSVMMGQTGEYNQKKMGFNNLVYMPCNPENNFFPDLEKLPKIDLIYFCSPNNPTGAVASREQLKKLVDFAKSNQSILIYDAAYAPFIHDSSYPHSIYEIPGAHEVAIELGSFSKLAGFTGIRLGWNVVPENLRFDDGSVVKNDWSRVVSTFFNAASHISMMGGLAVLEDEGWHAVHHQVRYYLENARLIKEACESKGYKVYGGVNAPYLWVNFPGKSSWDVFNYLLEEAHILTTPGSGFGPSGESFVRMSAFGKRKDIEEAVKRLSKFL